MTREEERLEDEKLEREQSEQAKRIIKRMQGKRSLPEKDVIEIQRRKAVAAYQRSRRA
jgi:hypothetical protein